MGVPAYESDADREKQTELFFEKHKVPALFLARNAMLSAFSLGRPSGLVVDIGAAKTCVSVVNEGYVLQKSLRTSPVAGDYVDEHLLRVIESTDLSSKGLAPSVGKSKSAVADAKSTAVPATIGGPFIQSTSANAQSDKENTANGPSNIMVRPMRIPCMFKKRYSLDNDGVTRICEITEMPADVQARVSPGYIRWQKQLVLNDLKNSTCRMWSELKLDEIKADTLYVKERYELPDGTEIFLGKERFKSQELLIHPELDQPFMDEMLGKDVAAATADKAAPSLLSVTEMVCDALKSTHVDLRKEVTQNIILVGGASVLPGTIERLTKELAHVLPSALKPRFLAPGKQERVFSTFTGGSILASLGSFQQLWISKAEYDEYGAAIVAQRCIH